MADSVTSPAAISADLSRSTAYAPERFLGLEDGAAAISKAWNFDYRAADFDRIVAAYEAPFGADKVAHHRERQNA